MSADNYLRITLDHEVREGTLSGMDSELDHSNETSLYKGSSLEDALAWATKFEQENVVEYGISVETQKGSNLVVYND